MSNEIIRDVSSHLRQLLVDAQDSLPGGGGITVDLQGPTTIQQRLSLWLYRVAEDEFTKNRPLRPKQSGDISAPAPPLALNLFYLVTPLFDSEAEGQLVLGWAMHAFHQNPISHLNQGQNAGELRISLDRLSLEDQTRIWNSLKQPFRLSAAYQVRVISEVADSELPDISRIDRPTS